RLSPPVSRGFAQQVLDCQEEASRMITEGKLAELQAITGEQKTRLEGAMTTNRLSAQYNNERAYLDAHVARLGEMAQKAAKPPQVVEGKAREFILGKLPTFIYMDDYRTFSATAFFDQLAPR